MDREPTVVFSEPIPNEEEELFKSKGTEEYGLYLLRKNYRVCVLVLFGYFYMLN